MSGGDGAARIARQTPAMTGSVGAGYVAATMIGIAVWPVDRTVLTP